MGFNINFGQSVIANAQRDRQLDLEQQRINNQREAQAASAANQASASFWSRVNAEEANANRKKELELREERQTHDLSWEDAVKKQELAEREARTENLKKLSSKYDAAFESDKAKAEEEVSQARERQNLLNSELGTLYLSAYKRGGRVSPSQIQAFNSATGSQYDFIGNTMTIPMQDGSVKTEVIGDGKSFFLGQFQRDAKGDIVYGKDGTPVTQMVEMPRQMQRALLSSAYGRDYMGSESRNGLSLSDRLELEDAKNAGRMGLEELRQRGASARTDANNQTRREIAGAQIASREKIAEAANVLKQYGIDVSAELKDRGYDLQEERNAEAARHNKESEGIAGSRLREQERHNRAGEEVADRRASAQEQRVEDQYELGDRKQRHNENRLQNDKDKAARAAGQRDAELAERKRQFDEREKRLSKPKDQGGAGEDSRKAVSAMKGMLELARSSGMSEEDLADLESWTNERIKGLAGIGGETSGDGGTKGKVKYTDLKPGQKFTMTDKDGKKRRCVKTEKGYKYID